MDTIQLLRSIPLFDTLDDEDLKVALGRLERFIEKLRNEDKASC